MKRNLYLSLICYIFCLNSTEGQNWEWAIKTGNALQDEAHSIGVDNQNNVYVTGCDYNFSGGGASSGSYYNEWLFKFDSAGQLVWKTQLDIGGTKAVTDSTGNIYITAGNFIEKYNNNGAQIWSKSFANALMKNIILHPDGGVAVSGENTLGMAPQFGSITLSGNSRFFLAHIDENGTPLWATEQDSFCINSLVIGTDKNIYSLGSKGSNNMRINRYSEIGILEEELTENIINTTAYKISIDVIGNLYVTGKFSKNNPITINGTIYNCDKWALYIIKYNSAGDVLWVKILPGYSVASTSSIITDKSNNLYFSSFFNTSMTVDSVTFSSVGTEGFVIKFDTDGNLIWIKKSIGTAGVYSPSATPVVIALNNSDEIFIAGSISGDVSFDSFSYSHQNLYKDMFVAKISDINIVTSTKLKNDLPNKDFAVFPNPNRGIFTVKIEGIQSDLLKLEVRNVLGQRIYSKTYKNQDNDFIDQIDISNQSKGIYLIEIIADKAKHVKKIVLE